MLIHRINMNGHLAVLDINSGAVHLIDETVYDILGVYDGSNDDETIEELKKNTK